MSYESYRARLNVNGGNIRDSVSKMTKRTQVQQILNSPTRQEVLINDSLDIQYCLVSDVKTFKIRRFLLLPDTTVYTGDYLHYEDYTYLVTDRTTADDFPQVVAELCNEIFPLTIAGTRYISGYDSFGKPKYKYTESITYNIPCVLSTKIYSTVDNSSIPLPDGSIMIKIPYDKDKLPPTNYEFQYKGSPYKVTTFDYDDVINDKGFIEMRLQRVTGGDST